jgi:hypothetical protein
LQNWAAIHEQLHHIGLDPDEMQLRILHNHRRRPVPEWMRNDKEIIEFLGRVFPRMKSSPSQRRSAGLWLYVINQYFVNQRTNSAVAAQLNDLPYQNLVRSKNITSRRITQIAYEIRCVADGLRSDGKKRTGRKVGRPKKPHKSPNA